MPPSRPETDSLEGRIRRIEASLGILFAHLGLVIPEDPGQAKSDAIAAPKEHVTLEDEPATTPRLHTHRPVDSSRNEIRLLALKPSKNEGDPLEGNLLHVSLNDRPTGHLRMPGTTPESKALVGYSALSYTWGRTNPDSTITLDGQYFHITESLDHALRKLRMGTPSPNMEITRYMRLHTPSQVTYWWIDAICISQTDIEERNSQVALMRQIYSSAAGVCVWLGDEADGSEEAILLVEKILSPPRRGPGQPESAFPSLTDEGKLRNLWSLSSLFHRPWWDRVWVRQEVSLHRNVVVLCGNACSSFVSFEFAAKAVQYAVGLIGPDMQMDHSPGSYFNHGLEGADKVAGLNNVRVAASYGDVYADLCQLLFSARGCLATDPRDKVFGVLGRSGDLRPRR